MFKQQDGSYYNKKEMLDKIEEDKIEEDKQFRNAWIRAQNDAVEQVEREARHRKKKELREGIEVFNSHQMVNIKKEIGNF